MNLFLLNLYSIESWSLKHTFPAFVQARKVQLSSWTHRNTLWWTLQISGPRVTMAGPRWLLNTQHSHVHPWHRGLLKTLTWGVIPWHMYTMGTFSVSGPWSRHKSVFREFCSWTSEERWPNQRREKRESTCINLGEAGVALKKTHLHQY